MPPAAMARPLPKNKVISILDRARSAMESSYGYDDPYGSMPEPPVNSLLFPTLETLDGL
jgi:hypothetical protein